MDSRPRWSSGSNVEWSRPCAAASPGWSGSSRACRRQTAASSSQHTAHRSGQRFQTSQQLAWCSTISCAATCRKASTLPCTAGTAGTAWAAAVAFAASMDGSRRDGAAAAGTWWRYPRQPGQQPCCAGCPLQTHADSDRSSPINLPTGTNQVTNEPTNQPIKQVRASRVGCPRCPRACKCRGHAAGAAAPARAPCLRSARQSETEGAWVKGSEEADMPPANASAAAAMHMPAAACCRISVCPWPTAQNCRPSRLAGRALYVAQHGVIQQCKALGVAQRLCRGAQQREQQRAVRALVRVWHVHIGMKRGPHAPARTQGLLSACQALPPPYGQQGAA